MPIITEAMLESGRSDEGGWNKAQVRAIGIPWPLKEGWKRRHSGQEITHQQYEQFMALRGRTKAKVRRESQSDAGSLLSKPEYIAMQRTAAVLDRLEPREVRKVLKSLCALYEMDTQAVL
jgi:hypothetical protein